jgi:hypothetical protein
VRIVRPCLAAIAIVCASSLLTARATSAQETITVTEDPAMAPHVGASTGSGDCGPACGPVCGPACGTFHANPWGQLHPRRHVNGGCVTLPPCLPRLHAWCREGYLPSPTPPVMPRCHQCGATIEGGF